MAFEELETISKKDLPPQALIAYVRPKPRGKNAGRDFDRDSVKPELTITLPTRVCISKAPKFVLQVGTGDHKGKLRIVGVPGETKKAIKPIEMRHCIRLRFGFVPRFGEEIFDDVHCFIERVSNDVYELDLPISLDTAPPAPALADKKPGGPRR